ncbi:hypothetical protein ACFW04_014390 [Cataglyphis niger]
MWDKLVIQDYIMSHIAKIISYKLMALGEPVTESMITTKILLTLPPYLNYFPTLANLTSRLMIEKARIIMQDKATDSTLTVKSRRSQNSKINEQIKPKRRTREYFKYGKKGHWKREYRSKTKKMRKQRKKLQKRSQIRRKRGFRKERK